MTVKYRDSGLYGNFSNDPFFTEKNINLAISNSYEDITNIDNKSISKEISYDIDVYDEYYKTELEEPDYDERKLSIKQTFWEELVYSRDIFFIPAKYNPKKALEAGLKPFKYQGIGMLACGWGDKKANLELYQFFMDNSFDKDGMFCSPARDDIVLEYKVGKTILQHILEKVSEVKKTEAEKNKEVSTKE